MSISKLSDNVLLEIFDFYRNQDLNDRGYFAAWNWHTLVHVCRRWRQIILASPNRLDLRILCTQRTPVRKSLSIWPPFPITVYYCNPPRGIANKYEDNIVAALEHPDRVRYLKLDLTGMQLEKLVPVMQDSFPVLMALDIFLRNGNSIVLPADFLGGSAPCLKIIHFDAIPFPGLPALLLSATDLVTLELNNIPPKGYISPDAIIGSLVALPRLKHLTIVFEYLTTQLIRTHPPLPPTTHVFLPALTSFNFQGAGKYLEALVVPIDGPQLTRILIDYSDESDGLVVAEFSKFFDRSASPEIIPTLAKVHISGFAAQFDMYRHANHLYSDSHHPSTRLSCQGFNLLVPELAHIFSQFFTVVSTIVHLKIYFPFVSGLPLVTTGAEWLPFFNHLSTVQALYISPAFARHIARGLANFTGEMIAEAWPSLDLICLEDQPTSSLKKFILARRLSGRPVTVVPTEKEFDQRVLS